MNPDNQNSNSVVSSSFEPINSGQTDRWLQRSDTRFGDASALDQSLGIFTTPAQQDNANGYIYERTIEFPQPSISGIGVVTSAGAKDTTRYFFSQNWVVSRLSAGLYKIVHNFGDNKYNVQVSPVNTAAFTANISAYNLNDFQVATFNAAGTATDCSFTFVVFVIP